MAMIVASSSESDQCQEGKRSKRTCAEVEGRRRLHGHGLVDLVLEEEEALRRRGSGDIGDDVVVGEHNRVAELVHGVDEEACACTRLAVNGDADL